MIRGSTLKNYGDLANDHRHQIKARGTYALTDNWQFGGNLNVLSGGPISAFGAGNPYDATNYHSNFICVQGCDGPSADHACTSLRRAAPTARCHGSRRSMRAWPI